MIKNSIIQNRDMIELSNLLDSNYNNSISHKRAKINILCNKLYNLILNINIVELLYFYILNFIGWIYISCVTLQRTQNIIVVNNTYLDFLWYFITLIIIYIYPVQYTLNYTPIYKRLVLSIYSIFYILGCNFTYLDYIEGLDSFILDSQNFKYNNPIHLFIFVSLIVLIVFTIGYNINLSKNKKLVTIISLAIITIFLIITVSLLSIGYEIHIHHFMISLIIVLTCYYPTNFNLIIQSIALGIYTEGIARWGYANFYVEI